MQLEIPHQYSGKVSEIVSDVYYTLNVLNKIYEINKILTHFYYCYYGSPCALLKWNKLQIFISVDKFSAIFITTTFKSYYFRQ